MITATTDRAYLLYQQGRYEEACALCDTIISRTQDRIAVQINAQACHKLGKTAQALSLMEQCVQQAPDDHECCYSYALMLLYAGEFDKGWHYYERRLFVTSFGIPALPKVTRWHGQDLYQKRLLVVCEQGYGDCILFARYLPLLKQRGAELILACFPVLEDLLKNEPYIDHVITKYDPTPDGIDYTVHLCTLAGIFAANWNNIPTPLLFQLPSEEKKNAWLNRLSKDSSLKEKCRVGIAWSGRASNEDDINRSCTLENFLGLQTNCNIELVSLQKHELMANTDLCQLGAEVNDFSDVAAVVSQLDWVITVDTAVAHLAASMGKETWVVLPNIADWRWRPDGSDNPWYPTARIFRQRPGSGWAVVFNEIEEAITAKTLALSQR